LIGADLHQGSTVSRNSIIDGYLDHHSQSPSATGNPSGFHIQFFLDRQDQWLDDDEPSMLYVSGHTSAIRAEVRLKNIWHTLTWNNP